MNSINISKWSDPIEPWTAIPSRNSQDSAHKQSIRTSNGSERSWGNSKYAFRQGCAVSLCHLRNRMKMEKSTSQATCSVKLAIRTNLEAYIVVPQSDIGLIQEQQRILEHPTDVHIWIKLFGHVGDILTSKLSRISKDEITELPPALSNKMGGEVQTKTDKESERELPAFRSYAVLSDIPNPDKTLTPGVRGIARFDVGYRSTYWRIKRYIQQTLNFKL